MKNKYISWTLCLRFWPWPWPWHFFCYIMPCSQMLRMGGSAMKQTTNSSIQCETSDVSRIKLILQMLQVEVTVVGSSIDSSGCNYLMKQSYHVGAHIHTMCLQTSWSILFGVCKEMQLPCTKPSSYLCIFGPVLLSFELFRLINCLFTPQPSGLEG